MTNICNTFTWQKFCLPELFKPHTLLLPRYWLASFLTVLPLCLETLPLPLQVPYP